MAESPTRVRVLVADDHPVYREVVAEAIGDHPELDLIGECATGTEALAFIEATPPDVCVLDLRLPEVDGLEVLGRLRTSGGDVQVLILSAFAEAAAVEQAIGRGAAGYLSKDSGRGAICDAILAIAGGETVLPPGFDGVLASQIHDRGRSSAVPGLTERELEMLRLTADGHSAPSIADRLSVSAATVKTHLQNAYEKLGVSDRAAAVAEAMRRGLLR
jgi:two-component system nitrate/nitrite response regulator NarL